MVAFHVERNLARDGKEARGQPRQQRDIGIERHAPTIDLFGVQRTEDRIGRQHIENIARRMKRERSLLAQSQKARDVIDIPIGQQHRRDRCVAQRARVQCGRILQLLPNVG